MPDYTKPRSYNRQPILALSIALSLSRGRVPRETPYIGPPWWRAALWLALALLFQITLAHVLAFRGAVPSAVLVVVVWYAIRVDARQAAIYGLVAGLCEDLLATNTGGAWTVSTTVVAVLAGFLSRNFFADSLPLAATLVALATLVRAGLFWGVMALTGYPSGLGNRHLHEALWQAFLNALLMVGGTLVARRLGEA